VIPSIGSPACGTPSGSRSSRSAGSFGSRSPNTSVWPAGPHSSWLRSRFRASLNAPE
jgi:hypothetical protein